MKMKKGKKMGKDRHASAEHHKHNAAHGMPMGMMPTEGQDHPTSPGDAMHCGGTSCGGTQMGGMEDQDADDGY